MITFDTAVYSAFRGYSWSRIPDGLSEALMDGLRSLAAEKRGDFPDPEAVDAGVVALGPTAAAYTIRSVPDWDSAGRASEYAAFVFFPSADAARIDFGRLLAHPFFSGPTRTPAETIVYDDGPATAAPLTAAGPLVCRRHLAALPAAQGGDLLAKYFPKCGEWIFRANPDGTMSVDCSDWKRQTEDKQ